MDKQRFFLANANVRDRAVWALRAAPDGYVVEIKPPTRSLEQNAHFHALCSDLAKSDLEWDGKRRSAEEWKTLTVSGHAVATGIGAELTRGLEGELLNLRESTARMSVSRTSSLIEYVVAFCSAQGVELMDARDYRDMGRN